MNKSVFKKILSVLLIAFVFMSTVYSAGCGGTESSSTSDSSDIQLNPRTTNYNFLVPEASGVTVYSENDASIDYSNVNQGYVMVKYDGEASNMWVQIKDPSETIFSYSLRVGDYETFPLSSGDGQYTVSILKNIQDDMYALILTQVIDVAMDDEFLPFLYPNQYVWYKDGDEAVKLGIEMSEESETDLEFLTNIYHYIIDNIDYDYDLAQNVETGYIPDNSRTLSTKKGICFDYASLMASMLRSQNIPTKLVVGYAGTEYHAWISVYLKEMGWIDKIIEFDGTNWSIMDPTMAATSDSSNVKKHVDEGEDFYKVKYCY